MNQPSRRPHPAWLPLAAAAGAAAALLTLKATAPPTGSGTWSGKRTQPWVVSAPGAYAFPSGALVVGNDQQATQQVYGCDLRANHTTVRGLTSQHFFRDFSFRNVADVTLDHCAALGAGMPGSNWGTGGQGFYGDHLTRFAMQDCASSGSAGHGLYIAETAQTVRLVRLNLSGPASEHAALFQLNSEGGTGIFDVEVRDSTFASQSQTIPIANFLGCGTPALPVLVAGSAFRGGRPQAVAVDVAGSRPSFARFQDTTCDRAIYVGNGCTVWLAGASKGLKTTGPGRVVRQ